MLPYTILLWVEYAACGLAVLAASAWLGRRLDRRVLAVCWFLPVIFLLPAFTGRWTLLPLDHAQNIAPWNITIVRPWPPRNIFMGDIATQMLPWNKAVRMAWKEGSLPWLDRWNGCGTPLFANGTSAAFSPLLLLSLPLPMVPAFALTGALKIFLCLAGMWLWLRELRLSRTAALFGAVSFSLSLTMTPWIDFPQTAVICLWPWALFGAELLRDRGLSRRAFLLLVLIFTVWPLQGHLESVMLWGVFAALWVGLRWAAGDLPEGRRVAGRLALAVALALGLSAFALLPQLSAILASNRFVLARVPLWARNSSLRPHAPVWDTSLYTSILPRTLGDGITSPMLKEFPGGGSSFPEMTAAYFGLVGWAILFLIFRPGSRRSRAELCFFPVALLGWGAAMDLWPIVEIIEQIPALKMMIPMRFLTWTALSGSAVAAFELDRLRKDMEERRRPAKSQGRPALGLTVSAAALAAFAVFTYFRFRDKHIEAGGLLSQQRALAAALAVLAIVALAGALAAGLRGAAARRGGRLFLSWRGAAVALTILAAAELLYQGMRLYGPNDPVNLFPSTPLVRWLRQQSGTFRVAGGGKFLFPNSNVFAEVEDVRTHDPVERRDYVEFLDAACGYAPEDYFKVIRDLDAPALDLLNVRYLLAPAGSVSPAPKWKPAYSGPDGTVFENRDTLPRVFVPRTIRRVPPTQSPGLFGLRNANAAFGAAFSEIVATRDWSAIGYVLSGAPPGTGANGRAEIRDVRETTNTFSFRSSAGSEALAVASVTNDGGWSARDERGRRLEVLHADGPFLAVELPAGEHAVTLTYRPPGLAAGGAVSAGALAAAILVFARRRRPAGPAAIPG